MGTGQDTGSASSVRLTLTGDVCLETAAGTLEGSQLGGRRGRIALVVLAGERHRSVLAEELGDALWPDALPSSWRAGVRVAVSKVRDALSSVELRDTATVEHTTAGYRLLLPREAEVDVEGAEAALDAAEEAFDAAEYDRACHLAAEATAVTDRPFLHGEHSQWVDGRRERLASQALRALTVLTAGQLELGRHRHAVAAAEELVQRAPLAEAGHRLLMTAHQANGDRGAALDAFARCRQWLADELGVSPSAETLALHQELLTQPAEPPAGTSESTPSVRAPQVDLHRFEALLALAESNRRMGRPDEVRAHSRQAARIAQEAGDAPRLARAALTFATSDSLVSRWVDDREAADLLDEALEALGDAQTELRVEVLAARAVAAYHGDGGPRSPHARAAVKLGRRLGSPAARSAALTAERMLLPGPANAEARLRATREVTDLARRLDDRRLLLRTHLDTLGDLWTLADRAGAERTLERALVLANDVTQPHYRWRAFTWDALSALAVGDYERAERRAGDAVAVWGSAPTADALQCFAIQLTTLRTIQERPDDALPIVLQATQRFPTIPSYRGVLALLHALRGDHPAAQRELEALVNRDGIVLPDNSDWLIGIVPLAETAALLHHQHAAHTLYAALTPLKGRLAVHDSAGAGGAFWGSIDHQLGVLAATTGHQQQARGHLKNARQLERAFGAQPWLARTERRLAAIAAGAALA